MSAKATKFSEGERVLCFHGPLMYEAKAVKISYTKDKQVKYYIHYAGWNKNWDEWVPENRVLKLTPENMQRQKELLKTHHSSAASTKKKGPKGPKKDASSKGGPVSGGEGGDSRPATPSKELTSLTSQPAGGNSRSNRSKLNATPNSSTSRDDSANKEDSAKDESRDDPAPAKKKRGGSTSASSDKAPTPTPGSSARADSFVDSDDSGLTKIEVKIKIPDDLKQCLADDWDAITRQHKLLDIPAKLTVQDIVDQYIASKRTAKSVGPSKEVAIVDVLNGVIEYFNVMLGSQLLYKFERPQYAEILQQYPETPVSKLYGSFHLLRLFVKLGTMLGFSALDEKSMAMLLVHLNDFLKFLVKNSASYFTMASFVNATPEYHRNTQ